MEVRYQEINRLVTSLEKKARAFTELLKRWGSGDPVTLLGMRFSIFEYFQILLTLARDLFATVYAGHCPIDILIKTYTPRACSRTLTLGPNYKLMAAEWPAVTFCQARDVELVPASN